MKGFKKLALTAAICSAPMAASALEAMDDSVLAGVTGQDGITMTMNLNVSGAKLEYTDNDGLSSGEGLGAGNAGLVGEAGVLSVDSIGATGSMVIDVDAGSDGTE